MKRAINFRPLVFVFLGMLLGIVFASLLIQKNLVAFIIFSILILLLAFWVLWVKLFKKSEKANFVVNFILCLVIGIVVSLSSGLINYYSFSKNLLDKESKYFVTARVETCNYYSNYYVLILEDLKFYDGEIKTTSNAKMRLTFSTESEVENLEQGSHISFYSSISQNSLFQDGEFNSYYYKNNLKFSASTSVEDLVVSLGELRFDETIKEKVRNILYSNMDYDTASLSYASIFGDKTMLNQNIYTFFSISGTAHILAVSGLHVGFLASIILWVLKKSKLNDKYSFAILAIILILYCYLCQFSPSVVRASIMSLVLSFSKVIGKRNDNLSSISFAGILILIVKPFYLFDLGFQLSFASCFGIFLLMPQFERLFKKIKFDNKLTSALSLTLSAQIGTFPILMHNFEKLSFISIIANLIIVPLFSILFTVLISVVLINLIFGFGFLFIIPNYLYKLIILLARFFGSFEVAIVSVSGLTIIANILFYLLLFCVSRFLIVKNYFKYALVGMCTILFVISAIIGFIPINFNNSMLLGVENTGITIITNSSDYRVLINTGKMKEDETNLINYLKTNKINRIDAIIYTNLLESEQDVLMEFCNKYKVKKIFANLSADDEAILNLSKKVKNTEVLKTEDTYYFINDFTFKISEEVNAVDVNLLQNNLNMRVFVTNKLSLAVINFIKQNNVAIEFISTRTITKDAYFSIDNEFSEKIIFCKECQFDAKNILKDYNKIKLESYL